MRLQPTNSKEDRMAHLVEIGDLSQPSFSTSQSKATLLKSISELLARPQQLQPLLCQRSRANTTAASLATCQKCQLLWALVMVQWPKTFKSAVAVDHKIRNKSYQQAASLVSSTCQSQMKIMIWTYFKSFRPYLATWNSTKSLISVPWPKLKD